MRDIYIILSQSGTKVSKFLNFFTKSKYTHVSICLDSDFNTFYSFARRNIKIPIFGGIVEEHPNKGIFSIYPSECIVYKVEVKDCQYKKIKQNIQKMMKEYDKYTYNFIGILLLQLGIPLKRKYRFVCTQFVAYVLENNNIDIINAPWELAKPQDFRKIKAKQIFSGKVNELPYCFT